jgi:hypothetical protein
MKKIPVNDTYFCKHCQEERPASDFYSRNKSTCKKCIVAKKKARRTSCPVDGCDGTVDHRSKTGLCKHHTNLAWHNGVDYSDLEAIARLQVKEYKCRACGVRVNCQYEYCMRCTQIKHHYPEYSDEEIAMHETRAVRVKKRKEKKAVYESYLEENELRLCPRCKSEKSKEEWYSDQSYWCKACYREGQRNYYHSYLKHDPCHNIRHSCKRMVSKALKRVGHSKAGKSFFEHVPYTVQELKTHLETQFTPKMSWDNYGSYWVIDHIVPQAVFSYTSMDSAMFEACWSLKNLQPLERTENNKKSSIFRGKRWNYDPSRWE